MLKPWVVYTLLWTYKGGLLFAVAGAALLGSLRKAFPADARLHGRNLNLLLLGLCGVVGGAGWMVGFQVMTFVTAGFAALAYGLCRLSMLAWLPLAALASFGLPLGAIFLEDQHNEVVPQAEIRLSRGLTCRAYPKWYYSLIGSRLVLARTDRSWFFDEITEGPALYGNLEGIRCEFAPDGRVALALRAGGEEKSVAVQVD